MDNKIIELKKFISPVIASSYIPDHPIDKEKPRTYIRKKMQAIEQRFLEMGVFRANVLPFRKRSLKKMDWTRDKVIRVGKVNTLK